VNVLFPSANEMVEILDRTTGTEVPVASKVVDGEELIDMMVFAREVPVPSNVSEYVARFIVATHPTSEEAPEMVRQYVRYGASPRGAQALILGGKLNALLNDRFNVAFEDVESVAPASLRHRLILNYEALAEGILPDAIIEDLIRHVQR
jgi:MoxR-like ATPase